VRDITLARKRDGGLRDDIVAMRRKMRAELDRSDPARFDLKQGEGGLVDLEFQLQHLVLRNAHAHPALLGPRDTLGLLREACAGNALDAATCDRLAAAHAVLLDAGLRCTLDRRPRITTETEAITGARATIRDAAARQGLDFG
jgi:glutamate-ammonia-ligase adenylyltransferase